MKRIHKRPHWVTDSGRIEVTANEGVVYVFPSGGSAAFGCRLLEPKEADELRSMLRFATTAAWVKP